MTNLDNLTCECGGDLFYYDTELFREDDDGCIFIRYTGECDKCHKKYIWETKYQPIKTSVILIKS